MPEPSFNTWTSFFLVVSASGIFLSFVLAGKEKARQLNFPIILLMFGFSAVLLQYVFFWTGYLAKYPFLYFYDNTWYLAFGPLIYLYIVKFYNKNFHPGWYHFAPALLLFVLTTIYFIKSGGEFSNPQFQGERLHYFFRSIRSPWLGGLSMVAYLFIAKNFISFHAGNQVSEYAKTRDRWAKMLILFFSLFILSYLSYFVLVRFPFFSPQWDYAISFMMSAGIYAIGYMVYKEPSIFNGELFQRLFFKGNGSVQFSEATKTEFYDTLLNYIHEEKPYLNNDLRMVQLADATGFSSHTLSMIINKKAGKNFNRFINDFRLREAEHLLKEEENISVKTIYFEVGFNNKASFYKAFKEKYNCTPLEYKQKLVN